MMMALSDITERKNAEQDLKDAYERIQAHIDSIKDMAWKQSHLIRSPLANLKGLMTILKDDPSEGGVFEHIKSELDRMDDIIIEMAQDASDHDI
jgi:two-component system, sporulation sensor kinase E